MPLYAGFMAIIGQVSDVAYWPLVFFILDSRKTKTIENVIRHGCAVLDKI